MTSSKSELELAAILDQAQTVVAAWIERLRQDATCRPPEAVDELAGLAPPLLEELADACRSGGVDLAADHFRAAVRDFSLLGGQLASAGASPSLLARLTPTLSDCLAPQLEAAGLAGVWRVLEVGLAAIVLETYCLALRAAERAVLEEVLEKHTPVIRLPGDVPALLVVGRPSRQVLSMQLGRLLLEVARMGADRLLVDFTHAPSLHGDVLGVIEELLDHRKLQQRSVVVTALERSRARELRARLGPRDNIFFYESWGEGLAAVMK